MDKKALNAKCNLCIEFITWKKISLILRIVLDIRKYA